MATYTDEQKFAKRSRSSFNGTTSPRLFNAAEANRILGERWRQSLARSTDTSVPAEDRTQTYKAPNTGSAWGKPSSHLQGRVDFLNAVKAGLAKLGAAPKSSAVPIPSK